MYLEFVAVGASFGLNSMYVIRKIYTSLHCVKSFSPFLRMDLCIKFLKTFFFFFAVPLSSC